MQPLKTLLKQLIPQPILEARHRKLLGQVASRFGIGVRYAKDFIEICRADAALRIALRHEIYAMDMISCFDYYFDAVRPLQLGASRLVDLSTPRYHKLIGFEDFPLLFPSIPEPYE